MSYRFVYPNGGVPVAGYGVNPTLMSTGYDYRRSYSPESFSSDSESSDDYEYRGRMITRETRRPRDIVRAPTPPPIIKRVVERAPTPEAPVMERVIIRPHAQEIVERVIEQPCTPPPRIVQKEMHEEAPPPIVRTRVIKVDRPIQCGFSQPGSPYGDPCNDYHVQSIVGSVGRPAVCHDNNPSFSSASSFEYAPPPPMMMMMPASQQQQMMYQPVQMQSSIPPIPSSYMPQNYMYPVPQHGMSFGYRPMMMQQARMIPSGMPMPMMMAGNTFASPANSFPSQHSLFNPMVQQLVY